MQCSMLTLSGRIIIFLDWLILLLIDDDLIKGYNNEYDQTYLHITIMKYIILKPFGENGLEHTASCWTMVPIISKYP